MHPSCTAVRYSRRRNGTAFTLRTSQCGNPPTESSCNEKTSVARHGCPGFSSSRSSEMLLQVLRAVHEVLSFADYSCIPHSSREGKQRKRLYHRLPTSPALDHSTCAGIVTRVRASDLLFLFFIFILFYFRKQKYIISMYMIQQI